MRHHIVTLATVVFAAAATAGAATAAAAPTERLYVQAVEQFRQGQFPAAYGRFAQLADLGHAASARHALWMCEQGLSLFGHEWDCAPQQVADWAAVAGVAVPDIRARVERRRVPAQPSRRTMERTTTRE